MLSCTHCNWNVHALPFSHAHVVRITSRAQYWLQSSLVHALPFSHATHLSIANSACMHSHFQVRAVFDSRAHVTVFTHQHFWYHMRMLTNSRAHVTVFKCAHFEYHVRTIFGSRAHVIVFTCARSNEATGNYINLSLRFPLQIFLPQKTEGPKLYWEPKAKPETKKRTIDDKS